MSAYASSRHIGALAIAAVLLSAASLTPSQAPIAGSFAAASAHAEPMAGMRGGRGMMGGMRGGRMMGGGGGGMMAAGLAGGLILGAMSHSYMQDTRTGDREDCIRFCGAHIHTSNIPGKPAVQIIKPPKLKRVGCAGGRCAPIKYGQYNLWPYTDANGNKYAQITDQNGNPVNTGAPGGQINGFTIIK